MSHLKTQLTKEEIQKCWGEIIQYHKHLTAVFSGTQSILQKYHQKSNNLSNKDILDILENLPKVNSAALDYWKQIIK